MNANTYEKDGIFYIENTDDEWHHAIQGYFTDLESAKTALSGCADWYRPNGTGRIYFQKCVLDEEPTLVFESR